jgi:hypothetical protein
MRWSRRILRLDHPIRPQPRWGYGRPAHPGLHAQIAAGSPRYAALLAEVAGLAPYLRAIPLRSKAWDEPRWSNPAFPPLDAATLYGWIATRKPALYVEIGSGESTRFARRAVRDLGLPTKIVSIDPHPSVGIDALCDEVIRQPFEATDLSWLSRVAPGDLIFLDGSHRVFENSDVVVAFLDVLPGLPSGVAFGIHDVYLPWDYPPEWSNRFYSEQYLLAALLLGGPARVETLLPNHFISHTPELLALLDPVWKAGPLASLVVHGEAFWLSTR